MFLIDTDVISATAPTKASPRADVLGWLRERGDQVYLSAITVTEVRRGVVLLAAKGQRRKARLLEAWDAGLAESFSSRILPIDEVVARRAGELFGRAEARGYFPGLANSCIAATAERHDLVVVTGNARHFSALGVRHQPLWSPTEAAPR